MLLTLHVGLPKTATTTIQHVMEQCKPALADHGVLYPGTTAFQLELVRRTQRDRVGSSEAKGSLGEAVERMAAEIRAVGPDRVVLSCEHMVLVPDRAVGRLQQVIAERLPEIRAVEVLCYVREPIAFAASLCLQRLKSGTTSLAEFAENPWPLNLRELLAKFARRYGQEAMRLRHLHRDHLAGGSVADDFLAQIGLAGFPLPGPIPILNPSLSQDAALVADALVRLRPRTGGTGRRNDAYKRALEAIPGPKFVLPAEVQARIIEASRKDLAAIRDGWGLDIRAEPVAADGGPVMSSVEALALAAAIVRQVEGEADDGGGR